MGIIIGLCVLFGIGYIAIGSWFYRKDSIDIGWAFWLGWAITIIALQIWHFFAPINDTARYVWFIIAGMSLLANQHSIKHLLVQMLTQKLLWALLVVLIGLWLTNRATFSNGTSSTTGYDAGFYHVPVITWFSQHPIIIGLGNVHTRFGFSNAHFLYGALLNLDILEGKPYLIANTLLYMVFLPQLFWSISRLFVRPQDRAYAAEHFFRALCTPYIIITLFGCRDECLGVPSTSNDVPIVMIGILLAGRAIYYIEKQHITLPDFTRFLILTTLGIVIKFNFIIFGGLLSLLMAFLYLRQSQPRLTQLSLTSCLIICITFIPMMMRSLLMTGYPFYPLGIGGLPVDWKVPTGVAQYETQYIQTFGRAAGYAEPFEYLMNNPQGEWLTFWLQRASIDQTATFYTTITLICLGIIIIMLRRKNPIQNRFWAGFFVIGLLSVLFWWVSAPLWRLSVGVTVFLGASLFVFSSFPLKNMTLYLTRLVFVCLTLLALADGFLNRGYWIYPVPLSPQPPIPTWTEPQQSIFGLNIHVAQDGLCWNHPFPCVPKVVYTPLLRERVMGVPASGYRIQSPIWLFEPTTYKIYGLSETFSALQQTQSAPFTWNIYHQNQLIASQTETIPPISLTNRSDPPYAIQIGEMTIPNQLPTGTYTLEGHWQNNRILLANRWDILSLRFGDTIKITDVILSNQENRMTVQLIGMPIHPIQTRYHVAIWLRGENGTFQQDVSPNIPTHDWTLDERYLIQAYFDNVPRGNYTLSVIFYDVYAPDLPRLQGFDDQNNPLGNDVILLEGDF
ncbi:MAG: hypothetical protein MUE54_01180 [Anaerolineae bacterium]|nr:hypothetical protein [Anaerolineae bacterium]